MDCRDGSVHEPDMLALQSAPRAAAHVLPRREAEQAKAEAWAAMVQQLEDEWVPLTHRHAHAGALGV